MCDSQGFNIREGARALILSSDDHILLVKFRFPDGTELWATPGGGREPNETHEQALKRELIEEVGLQNPVVGEHIWDQLEMWKHRGGKFDGQRDYIYLVRVPERFEPKPSMTWEQLNSECVFELRWWSVEELLSSSSANKFTPASLPTLVTDLVKNGPPTGGPIRIRN